MMKSKKIFAVVVLMAVFFAHSAFAGGANDSQEARLKAAKRYLEAVPMSKIMDDTLNAVAQRIPADKRAEFISDMKGAINIDAMEKLALDSMVKVFTAEELNALADFYGSKVGESSMGKMGVYMANVMQEMQKEVFAALRQLQREGKLQRYMKPS
ncbi:MAG: DUF2059 domain-containing protein [Nitrospiraceae bacterium]|nr:DUF2059 domain-containing protein [Nitrospiraceae bacterium]